MAKYYVSGAVIRRLMRRHKVTIREIAARLNVTLKRVREVRKNGAETYFIYCDWHQAITGDDIFRPR
jgi:transcriptional regulator with XRE-family HTH domain